MPTHRRRTSALGLTFALTITLALLSAPPGYTRQGDQGGGAPQDPPRGKSGERDMRGETPDPCQQARTPGGEAKGLHERCESAGGGGGAARGDFNGDGIADLAVGVPFEDQNGVGGVGGVNVIYGSADGLTSSGDQFLDATTFGLPYEAGDHFGWALASGDFNGDGKSDLAIGVPDAGAGRVLLIDGSETGLDTATARELELLGTGSVYSGRLSSGSAGEALVWADFNGDGFGDLAVGIPGRGFIACNLAAGTYASVGEVEVYYGGGNGLTQFGAQRFRQGDLCEINPGESVGGQRAGHERFGSSLAAGNFNGDTSNGRPVSDLVIGVPFDSGSKGAVHIIPGSSRAGLRAAGAQTLSQDTPGVGGAAEDGDQFGRSLAVGDFNADLRDDLAVGAPFEDLANNAAADAGAVHVLFGSFSSGEMVTTEGSLFVSQSALAGVTVEAGDRFGWALAVGRFDADGFEDLAVGVPGEDHGAIKDAGTVQVLYGSLDGPSLTRVQHWHQDKGNVPDLAEAGDQFGYALSAWNYGKGAQSDLAIGVPFEDLTSSNGAQVADAGAVIVVYGTSAGLDATAASQAQLWHQDVSGVNDAAQSGDRFGHSLY